MKIVQFMGNRSKADFIIYLAHSISAMKKRVLIVDATSSYEYYYGIIRKVEENEVLYDFNGFEILATGKAITNIDWELEKANECMENYDYILIDVNKIQKSIMALPIEKSYYVSDNIRTNIMKDIDLLHDYADLSGITNIHQLYFESTIHISEDYISLLTNGRFNFVQNVDTFEFAENQDYLKEFIQHEGSVPFDKLSKNYKLNVKSVAAEITNDAIVDYDVVLKTGLFQRIFNKRKPSNVNNISNSIKALPPVMAGEHIKEG
ncbi:hypothetical protein [Solibacillus isronensis]|uniref:hypothetical protein n=1 Tax=Solibacillus isronensis TaxID=412383 RepID=UPI0007FB4B00|nr:MULTISPECIES: hypothetical protein [Solibacillus]OBW54800.1 hypothetical protein A9986_14355 [Solibacillus silvestris]